MAVKLLTPQQNLGLRIKELRARQSVTQEELAERCGMFRTYVSRIESGLANPTLTVLHALAAGLKVELPELLQAPLNHRPAKVRSVRPLSRGRAGR